MRFLLVYFSPTGNTRKISNHLIDIIKARGYEVDIFNLSDCIEIIDKKEIIFKKLVAEYMEYDLAFFAFPIYNLQIPNLMRDYLKKLSINCKNASFISTYGKVAKGYGIDQAAYILSKKSIIPISSLAIPMEHSYLKEKDVNQINSLDLKERQAKIEEEIRDFFEETLERLKNNKSLKYKKVLFSNLLSQRLLGKISIKIPYRDETLCISCMKCFYACPTKALQEDLSILKSLCIRCTACVHVCPSKARSIEIKNPITRKIINLSNLP